ncbi:hypothetical protein GR702_14190 [Novosphingobium sp. FGD1]|uniref:Uncharacterized protein n=1 Tax=Novosphingobium silvae TaxID=2692619 RepID=A0A7X4GHX7_9SPHN|nr:hypothetical protein [Novosphingobium silvae]MYL98913.1 hypothetical protein [Novosphingobium silvae]
MRKLWGLFIVFFLGVVTPAVAQDGEPFWIGNSWAVGREHISEEKDVGGGISCSVYTKSSSYSAMLGIKNQPAIITMFMGTMQMTSLSFASPIAPIDETNSLSMRILMRDYTTNDLSSDVVALPFPERGGHTYIWIMPNEEGRRLAHLLSNALTVTIRNANSAVVQTIAVNDEGHIAFEKLADCVSG